VVERERGDLNECHKCHRRVYGINNTRVELAA
jgi:hypothetical protein